MKYSRLACALVVLGWSYSGCGSSPESEQSDINEQLKRAVKENNIQRAEELLKQGADPNLEIVSWVVEKPRKILAHSLNMRHLNMFDLFLKRGARPLSLSEFLALNFPGYDLQQERICNKRQVAIEEFSQWLQGQEGGQAVPKDVEGLIHEFIGTPKEELPRSLWSTKGRRLN